MVRQEWQNLWRHGRARAVSARQKKGGTGLEGPGAVVDVGHDDVLILEVATTEGEFGSAAM